MSVNAIESQMLNYIRFGLNTLVDFTDSFGMSAPKLNEIAEKMEQEGYIVKESYNSIGRFSWLLTDKGAAQLAPLSPEEEELLIGAGISTEQYRILCFVEQNPAALTMQISRGVDLAPNLLVTHIHRLVDLGYLSESGYTRRRVSATESGRQIISRYKNKATA